MPLLDDDRLHLFIILLLIPLQFVVWNYIYAVQTDADTTFKPSIFFKSNPSYIFDFAKNATKKLYHKAVNRLYSVDVSLSASIANRFLCILSQLLASILFR